MNIDDFAQLIIDNIKPMIEEHIGEQTMVHIIYNSLDYHTNSQTLNLNTTKGKLIFKFLISTYPTVRFDIEIGHKKYLSLYRKFVKSCDDNSSIMFPLFFNNVINTERNINLVASFDPKFSLKLEFLSNCPHISVTASFYTKIITAFGIINVTRHPTFSWINNKFAMNNEFYFRLLNHSFDFYIHAEYSEHSVLDRSDSFALLFYMKCRTIIVKKIALLYNINVKEVGEWDDAQLIEHYPIINMSLI
jgi:hypothetical protein